MKIAGWATPLVLLAYCALVRIVLGPVCIAIDCTGSDPTRLASDAFAWGLAGLAVWLLAVIVYWAIKLLVRFVRSLRHG